MKEAKPYGDVAVQVVVDTFITAYQTHKQIHGSFKPLIMDGDGQYVKEMDNRVHYQSDQARKALYLIIEDIRMRDKDRVPPVDDCTAKEVEYNEMRII